jgi:hypothetical protein
MTTRADSRSCSSAPEIESAAFGHNMDGFGERPRQGLATEPSLGRAASVKVFEIDPLQDDRWNSFIARHPRASVFHRREWLQTLKNAYDYLPVAFTLCSPGSPLTNAWVFCTVKSILTGKRMVSLPFSDHCEPLVESTEEARLLLGKVKNKVDQQGWKYAEVRPASFSPWAEILPVATSSYYLHRLDLRRAEEQLFKSFHKDCVQRKIRRAERESLRYQAGVSETLLNAFYKLLVVTRRKHHSPPQPLKWFRSLIESFGKDVTIRVAYRGDTAVASILTLTHGTTLTYKYGCSDPKLQNLGGTALLFWRAITESKANGFEEFDLGRSDMRNAGLVAFKEHWGAKRSTLDYHRLPVNSVAPEERKWAGWVLRQLVTRASNASLIKLGNLLYRHIG